MSTLTSLLNQRAELERQIDEAQRTERASVIAQIQGLMADHGLSADDLFARKS